MKTTKTQRRASQRRFERVLRGNVCGIIDQHGAVDSRLSPMGKGLLRHEDIWPMKLAGKWRWNHNCSIHCFCDTLSPDEYEAIRTHLSKRYGLEWWENGHHDIQHLMKAAGVKPQF